MDYNRNFGLTTYLDHIEGKKQAPLFYGIYDSSELTYNSNFSKQNPELFVGFAIQDIIKESQNSTRFNIPPYIKLLQFDFPIQDGGCVYFKDPFLIEWVYRINKTEIIYNNKLSFNSASREFQSSTTYIGETKVTYFGEISVENIIKISNNTDFHQLTSGICFNPYLSYGLIAKIRNENRYFLLRYDAAKSLADIKSCILSIMTNYVLYTEDYAQWASIKDFSGRSRAIVNEVVFREKYKKEKFIKII